jgi:hypothetical protein
MNHPRNLAIAVTLAAALPVIAGCAAPQADAQHPPAKASAGISQSPAATPASGLTKGMVLPLEAYEETYPESQTILQAQFDMESQCMRQYGFSYTATVDTSATVTNYDASNMARRYGVSDLATAESDGYEVSQSGAGTPSEPTLSQAENFVLTGSTVPGQAPRSGSTSPGNYGGKQIPAGGCSGQAQREIGTLPANLLADQLDAQSLTASQGDPTVIASISKWSACMKLHGFTVASPYNAPDLSAQLGATPGSSLDRTIAIDDVQCKQSTNLVATWFQIETKLQDQYIDNNQLALQQQQTILNNTVKNAEEIATRQ